SRLRHELHEGHTGNRIDRQPLHSVLGSGCHGRRTKPRRTRSLSHSRPAWLPRRAAPAPAMKPSTLHLPAGPWTTVLDCLCAHFPAISRETWLERFARGRVLDEQHRTIGAEHPHREGLRIRYFREVIDEVPIPFEENVLFHDEHLLVVDKPHFLPVIPAGAYVRETLLNRLIERFDNPDLVPLHRLDRLTAGLVLFSCNPHSRTRYQELFRQQRIAKRYLALAPALPHLEFPLRH